MSKIAWALIVICSLHLVACSNEEANVDVVISSSALPLIPAPAVSCLAVKNAGGDVATSDIAMSYFKVPKITFIRKNTTKTLVIAFLKIKIMGPKGLEISCESGGDGLAALSLTWWNNTGREASVPVGQASFETDCALYCGGIKTDSTFTTTGVMEVYGLERDPTTLDEVPVKIQSPITIQSF